MPKCSVIIPVYNKASLTQQCLDAFLARPPERVDCEIIVVDDLATDSTPQLLAGYGDRLRVVRHTANTGFATACNDGAAVACGEYLVFLNNDTIPQPGWLDALVRYAESHPRAAAVGSKLLYPNGTIQHAGVTISLDRYARHIYVGFPADHPAVNKSRRFQAVTGACMLMRRTLFEAVGGFDPAFVNGYEDVDLCLRLGERDHEVHYCHESVLIHLEAISRGTRSKKEKDNARHYQSRWGQRVQPDELQYYFEDGLLMVEHWGSSPLFFSISPLLGVVTGEGRECQADRLLAARSQQVFALLQDNIRLNVCLQEAALQAALPNGNGATPEARRSVPTPVGDLQMERRRQFTPSQKLLASDEKGLREMLLDAHEQLLRRDEELMATLATALKQNALDGSSATLSPKSAIPGQYLPYQQLTQRIKAVVRGTLPLEATVLVVSRGDNLLLQLDGRRAWHFPRNAQGAYAGYYPASSAEAIAHLEELRAEGAEFLLFPSTALWWLDHYGELREYLEQQYQLIERQEDTCLIFALGEPASKEPVAAGRREADSQSSLK
jgi:GT2 family glycosyltransferase